MESGCHINKSELLAEKDHLAKRNQWIFGGDGWGYDIGFGGGAAHRRRRAVGVRLPLRLPESKQEERDPPAGPRLFYLLISR
jgi:hypothetical protein